MSVLENSVAARNDGVIALAAVMAQEEKCIKQMINEWGLVDQDSILSMMKECKTANEKVLKGRKNISYKQHTIPACYGKKFSMLVHIQKYKVYKMWSIMSEDKIGRAHV